MKLNEEQLKTLTERLINWIKESMESSGGKKAIIGISGGKDSSVTAALCVKALGSENVIGILMPDGIQNDISFARELCETLDIKYSTINIENMGKAFLNGLENERGNLIEDITEQTKLNLPPRIRMTLLYAVSQSIDNSRVINTSNISEDWIGYATVYGDTAGAFSPLGMLTSDEVMQVGKYLGLDDKFTFKVPSDGLTGKSDEDIFGFTYETLNRYIREGVCEDESVKEIIDKMHRYSRHKFIPIPKFDAKFPIAIEDIAGVYKEKKS